MQSKPLSALPYTGGKSYKNDGIGRWVASKIPMGKSYCEPFCGMAGILLQRNPSKLEILNDKNELITNWWRVVRDKIDEFEYKIQNTPYSQSEFEYQKKMLNSKNDIDRALATHIIIVQGVSKLPIKNARFIANYSHSAAGNKSAKYQIKELSKRMIDVMLLNKDACDILEKICWRKDFVIYCDPPYGNNSVEYNQDFDKKRMTELVKYYGEAKIAISGYNNDWDHLGWKSIEKEFKTKCYTGRPQERIEKLWVNF